MSARSGAAPRGCSNPSLQPLRATVLYQLQRGCREVSTADRTVARPPRPVMRRTLSLDTIVAPYLQGQWPKEAEGGAVSCDKATQTPSSWAEETRGRRSGGGGGGGHKRSASWGSAEHLREVAKLRHQLQKRSRHAPPSSGCELPQPPLQAGHAAGITQTLPLLPLNRLASRLRRSVEGLNLELEEVFVSEKPDDQILDIPDGHRAPAPVQRCSSGSQSEPSPEPLDPSLLSPSQSPCALDPSLLSPSHSPCPLNPSPSSPMGEPEPDDYESSCPSPSTRLLPSFALEPPLLQPCSSSSSSSSSSFSSSTLTSKTSSHTRTRSQPSGGSRWKEQVLLVRVEEEKEEEEEEEEGQACIHVHVVQRRNVGLALTTIICLQQRVSHCFKVFWIQIC